MIEIYYRAPKLHQFRTVAAWVIPWLQLWLNTVPRKWNNTLELNYKGLKEPGVTLNHTSDFILFSTSFNTSGVWGTGMWTFHADRPSMGCVWIVSVNALTGHVSVAAFARRGRRKKPILSSRWSGRMPFISLSWRRKCGGCVREGFMVAAGIWEWDKTTSLTRIRHLN